MTPPKRWLAVLAAGGAMALGHSPAAAGSGTTLKTPVIDSSPKDTAALAALFAETKSLQTALSSARGELTRALESGASTIVDRSARSSSTGLSAQLAGEQATLSAERTQIQREQGQLATEAQALAVRQAQLVTEAASLTAEAKKLAHPSAHGRTGASGGNDNNDSNNDDGN